MTKKVNTEIKQKFGTVHSQPLSDDYYGDEDWWKKNILRWNKAQDVIGIGQTIWVLRITMGYKGDLASMDPMQWSVLFDLLTKRYDMLVKGGKINAKV